MGNLPTQELVTIAGSVGILIGTAITGWFSLRSKRVDKQIANGQLKVQEQKQHDEVQTALIAALEKRIDQLNARVEFLEKLHDSDLERSEQQEARIRAAEKARDANVARIAVLEVLVESQKGQIDALKAENAKLAERLKCRVVECPFIKDKGET